jgi:hypothetical protein
MLIYYTWFGRYRCLLGVIDITSYLLFDLQKYLFPKRKMFMYESINSGCGGEIVCTG